MRHAAFLMYVYVACLCLEPVSQQTHHFAVSPDGFSPPSYTHLCV